eukprot:symbB.v1.2.039616.t1/scaffold6683.1/size16212/3
MTERSINSHSSLAILELDRIGISMNFPSRRYASFTELPEASMCTNFGGIRRRSANSCTCYLMLWHSNILRYCLSIINFATSWSERFEALQNLGQSSGRGMRWSILLWLPGIGAGGVIPVFPEGPLFPDHDCVRVGVVHGIDWPEWLSIFEKGPWAWTSEGQVYFDAFMDADDEAYKPLGLEPPRKLHRLYDFVVNPDAGQVAVARNVPVVSTHGATQRTEVRDARMEPAEQVLDLDKCRVTEAVSPWQNLQAMGPQLDAAADVVLETFPDRQWQRNCARNGELDVVA